MKCVPAARKMVRLLFAVIFLSPPCSAQNPATGRGGSAAYFSDVTQKSGVKFRYLSSNTTKKYLPETMGAGVALFDYDNDGLLDIFLVNGAPIEDPTAKGTIPRGRRGPIPAARRRPTAASADATS